MLDSFSALCSSNPSIEPESSKSIDLKNSKMDLPSSARYCASWTNSSGCSLSSGNSVTSSSCSVALTPITVEPPEALPASPITSSVSRPTPLDSKWRIEVTPSFRLYEEISLFTSSRLDESAPENPVLTTEFNAMIAPIGTP